MRLCVRVPVCVCVRWKDSPCHSSCLFGVPRWCQSSPSQHISESWQMPRCPPAISASHPLSVSQSELSSAVTHPLFLSFYPASSPTISVEILIPLLLRSELSFQTRWVAHNLHTHCCRCTHTHKCIEIKARGLQTDIIKFELSWGGRVAAPFRLPSLVRWPAGVSGAGTNVHQWLLLIPNGLFLLMNVESGWMWRSLSIHRCRNTAWVPFPISPL